MKHVISFLLLCLLTHGILPRALAKHTLSEVVAVNLGGPFDKDGDLSSWVEIHNDTSQQTDLKNWYLTDDPDNLTKWRIPTRKVPAHGHALLFLSGKDFGSLFLEEVHANFTLSLSTDYLALVEPDGVTIAHAFEDLPSQRPGFSYGIDADGEATFFAKGTPGEPNEKPIDGFVKDTKFSIDRGFFTEPFQVEITTGTPGATIYYSTNGQEPGEGSLFTGPIEHLYSGPITIDKTTVLRAVAFKEGLGQSDIDTQTYIFTQDVAKQSTMRTSITESEEWGPLMDDALTSIPSISIVIDDDDHLVKRGGGQTPFMGTTVNDYESKVSVEWLNGDGSDGFQVDAGVSRFGGYYTDHQKYSYRFQFRKKYGTPTLKYPVFRGHENGRAPVETFDSLNLRSGSHDMQARGAYLSNRFCDDTMLEMGGMAPHGRFVHVYINGNYNGHYHLRERWNAAMHASYFGGSEDDYDAINRNDNFTADAKAFDGDQVYWKELEVLARNGSPWESLQGHIDLKDYYEFMMVWSSGNSESEMQAVGSKALGVPFTFYMKDADGWLVPSAFNSGRTRWLVTGPGRFNTLLRQEKHSDHQIFLADLIHQHFTHDGAMTADKMVARLQRRVDELETAFIAESARWGKYTPDAWRRYQQNIMNRHFSNLATNMLKIFKDIDAYPKDIQTPSFNQRGGTITPGFTLKISAGSLFNPEPGFFFYTLDGTDPRLPGGARSEAALVYDKETNGLQLDDTVTVKARTFRTSLFNSGVWSPLIEATFHIGERPQPGDLVISEIHYRPAKPSAEEVAAGFDKRSFFEFIEIYNRSDHAVSLHEVSLTNGVRFHFQESEGTHLAPHEVVLVVANQQAFALRYGNELPVAGAFEGFKLDDGGEALRLTRRDGVVLQELRYHDKDPWPESADGDGPSLTLKSPQSRSSDEPSSWMASATMGGSPGTVPASGAEFDHPDEWDQDGDGMTALLEEALGSSDTDPLSGPRNLTLRRVTEGSETHWTIHATRGQINGFTYELELSHDLDTWQTAEEVFEAPSMEDADGLTWRARHPVSSEARTSLFIRLKVTRS